MHHDPADERRLTLEGGVSRSSAISRTLRFANRNPFTLIGLIVMAAPVCWWISGVIARRNGVLLIGPYANAPPGVTFLTVFVAPILVPLIGIVVVFVIGGRLGR